MRTSTMPRVLLAASLITAPAMAFASTPGWMSVDKSDKTVQLTLDMGAPSGGSEYNFNGYSKGHLVVTVPDGWTVKIKAKDVAKLHHSVEIVKARSHPPVHAVKPAFSGAETPNPKKGVKPGHSANFSFKADKPGKYWLMCGVPGHALGGMWDVLKVSKTAKTPSVSMSKS